MADNYDYGYGYDWGYGSAGAPGSAGEEPTIDPNPGDGTPGAGWGSPGYLGTLLADLQRSGIGGALGSLFGGQYSNLAQMAAFGGLGALLNRLGGGGGGSSAVGYQGGIPKYTINRAQTPLSQQRPVTYESLSAKPGEMAAAVMVPKPYRPGQGGIAYFAPIQYNKAGYDLGSAPVAAAPATGSTTGGSNVGIDTDGLVATPGYTGPVTLPQGQPINYDTFIGSLIDPREKGSGTAADYASLERAAGVSGSPTGGTVGGTTGGTAGSNLNPESQLLARIGESYANRNPEGGVSFVSNSIGDSFGKVVQGARGGYMPGGGIAMYAGGRYLRGPGDGVSDSIPARFDQSGKPARLADGEFVIDARTVSEIGNGSSEAGARKLYAMMDRVHKARKTAKRGKPSGADKYLPK